MGHAIKINLINFGNNNYGMYFRLLAYIDSTQCINSSYTKFWYTVET